MTNVGADDDWSGAKRFAFSQASFQRVRAAAGSKCFSILWMRASESGERRPKIAPEANAVNAAPGQGYGVAVVATKAICRWSKETTILVMVEIPTPEKSAIRRHASRAPEPSAAAPEA